MLVTTAIIELKRAGYSVEVANDIVYVRETPNAMPDRLYVTRKQIQCFVSDRMVRTLLNRKQ
jgi:hypothetical protein